MGSARAALKLAHPLGILAIGRIPRKAGEQLGDEIRPLGVG